MKFQSFKHLPHLLFIGAIIVSSLPSLGQVGGFSRQVTEARDNAQQISEDITALKLAQQEADQKAAIAEARYQQGCIPVVSNDQASYVSLILNKPVVDWASKAPLPPGSIVCDAHGNTGVLVDDDQTEDTPAVVQKLAFTGNQDVVRNLLHVYQGATYGLPNN